MCESIIKFDKNLPTLNNIPFFVWRTFLYIFISKERLYTTDEKKNTNPASVSKMKTKSHVNTHIEIEIK